MQLGPGAMVAAAFIGPGTVATAITAGVDAGAGLLWAVVFSIIATVVLQELALRSALTTGRDLGALIRDLGEGHIWGFPLTLLVILALGVGNAAYQSGNLAGASMGAHAMLTAQEGTAVVLTKPGASSSSAPWVIGLASVFAALLIAGNRYQQLERVLVSLVALMAVGFLGLALALLPTALRQAPEFWLPSFDAQHATITIALIGTTVVPYNLFLHGTAVRKRWGEVDLPIALASARQESLVSILIGGVITLAIVWVAALLTPESTPHGALPALFDAVKQQFPDWGLLLLGSGLLAAGLTSALAAPVAAGWAVCGAMGWSTDQTSTAFRVIAFTVLGTGTVFAVVADRPALLIISAQAANGLLLPIVAAVLVGVANSSRLLGLYRNGWSANALALPVLCLVTLLAVRKVWLLL